VTIGEVEVDLLTGQHQVSRMIGEVRQKRDVNTATLFGDTGI
jgi:hypothetical protein